MSDATSPPAIPEHRRDDLERVLDTLLAAHAVVLTTHVNPDGDGAGSTVALAAWLAARGRSASVTCPTPFPKAFAFLLDSPDRVADPGTEAAGRTIRDADLLAVLDTAEPGRIGRVAGAIAGRTVVVLDHHPVSESGIPAEAAIRDPSASSTGELVYDMLRLADEARPAPEPWPRVTLEGLYTAIVTDTGGFRFANTTPRVHAVVADLLRRGVDPQRMYRLIYGSVPLRRVRLLERALAHLHVDDSLPITWISIPADAMAEVGATGEDIEGIVEHARTIEGTEVALLFRQLADGSTKVSWRSNGELDVNTIARSFGGGGHAKAAGALIGEPLEKAREHVLEATRAAVRQLVGHAPPP